MRIEFDSDNPTELNAVFVALAVLRGGDMSLPLLGDDDAVPAGIGAAPPATPRVVPPAPPVAAAPLPVASVAAPPPPVLSTVLPASTGVDVDADGLPWDARIHSTPASKKKDGKWRGRRGLDEATRATVTAELKQAMGAPTVEACAAPPPPPMFEEAAPGVPLPPPPPGGESTEDAATAFAAPAATVAASPPAPEVPAAPLSDFASLMRKITSLQSAGVLSVTGTTEIAVSLGIPGVRDLMHRPDLIPAFDALLPVAG